ncbi:C2 family cysteine protease [Lacrimispora sp. 38-1]|uniref:C2 family cysteine protease n=1 Tax=Lacrimispora sp. 38-1 TaxID=3125778 RepID=UPI003CF530A6
MEMRKIKKRIGALCLALGIAASTLFTPVTALAATGGYSESQLDGKLDTIYQGSIGDCGAVSAIQALDNSKYGRKIFRKMITDNYNGTYTLNFGGGRVTVTEDDVYNAYIEGDLDARVIEAGLQKAMNVYNGCFACDVFTRMTGFRQRIYRSSNKTEIMNTMAAKCQNGEGITAACDFNIADPDKGIIGDGGHSYSIKSVNKNTVVVINPWDTSVLISMPRSQFERSIRYMTYVDDAAKNVVVYWE